MKRNLKIKILSSAFLLSLLASFVLPFFNEPGYSIIRNTIGDLGAQSAPNAWIMNCTILLLASVTVYAGWGFYHGFLPQRIFLMLFSMSLILASLLRAAPADTTIKYDVTASALHEYFIYSAVFSFSLLSVSTGFIPEKQKEQQVALAAGISVILLSVLISEMKQLAGILQRIQFIVSFGWLIFNFRAGGQIVR